MIQWGNILPGFDQGKVLEGMDNLNELTLNFWYPQFANHPVTHDSLTAIADKIVADYVNNPGPPLGAEAQVHDNAALLGTFKGVLSDYIHLWDTGQANTEQAAELGYLARGAFMNAFWSLGGAQGNDPHADWVVQSGLGHNPTDPQYGLGHYTWFC